MKDREAQAVEQPTAKKPYEPPRATFVPLKLEERLLQCYLNNHKDCESYVTYS